VNNAPDSLKVAKNYVLGQISDDYDACLNFRLCITKREIQTARRGTIAVEKSAFDQFVFSFPSNLPVEQGVSYDYYFEVFDNDAIHNFKVRSHLFSLIVLLQMKKMKIKF
jgi:hypothetical protein